MPRLSALHPLALSFVALALQAAPPTHAQVWAQGRERIASPTPAEGSFGSAVALLDFDGDGDLELAVGDPLAQDDDSVHPVVRILFATESGWQTLFTFDQDGATGFGSVLAVGDFDQDGRDDLLIGAPQVFSGGGVYLVRHTDASTTILDGVILHSGSSFGNCGTSLAVGDFDDDDDLDFATGCPFASFDAHTGVGRVEVAEGFGNGNFSTGSYYHQASTNVADDPETGDELGAALAAGDFDGDGYDDLAVGVPGEDIDGGTDTGAIHVLFGSASGIGGTGSQLLHQGSTGVPGTSGDGDAFGSALAAADFDFVVSPPSCNCDDLAIGVPDDAENTGGAVVVLGGTVGGLGTAVTQLFDVADMPPVSGPSDTQRLGSVLAAGRLNSGFAADLVIGIEGWSEFVSTISGNACVLYGGASGLTTTSGICFEGSSGEFFGEADTTVDFGQAIAFGPLDDSGLGDELVLGSPGRREVFILKSALFADGFELYSTSRWSFDSDS